HGEPVRVVNDDLGLDLVFSPPKDIAIMIFAATASSTEDWGQQWACEYFLDATLGRGEAMALKRRLRMPSSGDLIDVAHLDPIIEALLERWSPATAPAANAVMVQLGAESLEMHNNVVYQLPAGSTPAIVRENPPGEVATPYC